MNKIRIPQLVAHRGYLQRFPENTWRGLEAALKAGAPWLEIDVQMCRDGEFVLLHDDGFKRTSGIDCSVFDLDSDEIGISVHEPGRFGDRFDPTPVSPLVEVLEKLRAFPGVRIMVELKQESIDRWGLDVVMKKLAPVLASYQPLSVLISFNDDSLQWCKARYHRIQTGWVLTRYDDTTHTRADELKPDYLICNELKIRPATTPWPGSWQWMLYDITDPDHALARAADGIDLVETAAIGPMLRDPGLKAGAVDHGL
jgi:glycerophosphoryl diester phosphodiesterase